MTRWIPYSTLLVSVSLLGCTMRTASGRHVVTVISLDAGDYHFVAPDTIRGGVVTFRARNTGTQLHHVQLVRFDQNHTVADLASAMEGERFPGWAHQMGGIGVVPPGDSGSATLSLAPGSYAFICFIPGPDGVPHFARGMMQALQVVEGNAQPRAPAADLVMVLDDYRYELSGALKRGQQTIEVTNAASQPHEVVIVRLGPDVRAPDFVDWFLAGATGPALGQWLGGTVGLARGERNWITVTLERGTYALLCFLTDHVDGRMHIEHGMVREITVE